MTNKLSILFSLLIVGLLSACQTEKTSDAYGNFEDDALIVSAESAGKLIYYQVEEGKSYTKSELLAVVDTMQLHLKKAVLLAGMSTIDSKVQNVESQRSVLNEQLDIQKRNQSRIKKMYKDGSATQKQLDDINAQVSITEQKIQNISTQAASVLAEKQSLEAQVHQMQDLINKSKIYCPIDGTILISFTKENEFVGPGKPLFSIQNTNALSLRAYVSETQLYNIKLGQKVQVNVDSDKGVKNLEGEIYWISSKAEFTPKQIQTKSERQNLVYALKIRVKNTDGNLKIGMPADINF
jgi:HlyD family secretion protein